MVRRKQKRAIQAAVISAGKKNITKAFEEVPQTHSTKAFR